VALSGTRRPVELFKSGHRGRAIHDTVVTMGDKSLKSKERDQKRKDAAKVVVAAAAKSKQEGQSHPQPAAAKGKK
jgi:hypothetical protein